MGGRSMDMVLIRDAEDLASLPLTKWGIRQPGESDKREEALEGEGIDLLIVPGLAFTSEGGKAWQGGRILRHLAEKSAQCTAAVPCSGSCLQPAGGGKYSYGGA